jgi:hypothetical protein
MTGRSLVAAGLVLATALAVAWASLGPAQATTWAPFFGPTDFYRLAPTAPSANGDTHAQYNVFPPSANVSGLFGRAITFGDADVVTASAAGIPNVGAYVGQLASIAQLGLANGGCGEGGSTVPVTFGLVDANVAVSASPMTPGVTSAVISDGTTTSFTVATAGGGGPDRPVGL